MTTMERTTAEDKRVKRKYAGLNGVNQIYDFYVRKRESKHLEAFLEQHHVINAEIVKFQNAFEASANDVRLEEFFRLYMTISPSVGISDLCEWYRKFCKQRPVKIIEKKTFVAAMDSFNEKFMNQVRDEPNGMFLPKRLGKIQIRKRRNDWNALRVDYGHLKKTGELIRHMNDHSDNFFYKYMWVKGIVKNISLYSLVPTRGNKRGLAAAIKKDGKDYFETRKAS
jgi:hypothetical protein